VQKAAALHRFPRSFFALASAQLFQQQPVHGGTVCLKYWMVELQDVADIYLPFIRPVLRLISTMHGLGTLVNPQRATHPPEQINFDRTCVNFA
jgi:hypothetical protein